MSQLWSYDPDIEQPDRPIIGHDVEATDGSVGIVAAEVDDDETSFLVVTTGKLLTKKDVVIPAGLVKQFNTDAEKIFLRVDRSEATNAPEFDREWRSDPSWKERATACFPARSL